MSRRELARLLGLARSLWLYYGVPGRLRAARRFYARFVRPGDLCFDIGAHAGSRTHVWLGLGARVVAVEPQPDFARFLRWRFGRRERFVLVEAALAAAPGVVRLQISSRHPTVSTTSSAFRDAVAGAASFRQVVWDGEVEVPALTLDQMIAAHGLPAFTKIDVEGFEPEVLAGLSQPLSALSFEYLAETVERACACIDRLERHGRYDYCAAEGEGMSFAFEDWLDPAAMQAWLRARPPGSGSGDVYARLIG